MIDPNPSERVNLLAKKWQEGTITATEKAEFENWYASFDNTFEINTGESREQAEQRIFDRVARKGNIHKARRYPWPRIAVAAAALLCLGIWSIKMNTAPEPSQFAHLEKHDIAPGGNKAILTLANGQQIVLNSAKNGQLGQQGNTELTITSDGQIAYHETGAKPASSEILYNTISTPTGGQYHLTLADGTNVWLNAESSIKYPTAFSGNERKVEITGEAYFEVAHNAAKPFRVKSSHQVVEVLGTHFNINSYEDDKQTRTTLLEGAVKVTGTKYSALIKPGQQAVLKGDYLAVAAADLEEAVAWKNGYFKFNENLEGIMSKVARWYDVSIVYQSRPDASYTFEGEISRTRHLSEILKIMEYTGKVHFTIEGRRIIVNK